MVGDGAFTLSLVAIAILIVATLGVAAFLLVSTFVVYIPPGDLSCEMDAVHRYAHNIHAPLYPDFVDFLEPGAILESELSACAVDACSEAAMSSPPDTREQLAAELSACGGLGPGGSRSTGETLGSCMDAGYARGGDSLPDFLRACSIAFPGTG